MPKRATVPPSFVPTGEGSINKKNRRYYARMEGYDGGTGQRSRPSIGSFATRKEARKALADANAKSEVGTRPDRMLTVEQYLMRWLKRVRLQVADNTFSNYSVCLRRYVIPRIGAMPLQAVTSDVLVDLYSEIAAHGGRQRQPLGTMPRKVHVTLHKAFGDAVPQHLPFNPATGVGPRKPKPNTAAWTEEELNTFLAAARDDLLASAFIVAATLGLRRNELLGLEWRDVDLDNASLQVGRITRDEFYEMFDEPDERGRRGRHVSRDKTRAKTTLSRRLLPLPPVTVATLHHYRKLQMEAQVAQGQAWHRSDRLFTDELGRPLQPARASKAFKRIATDAGLTPLTLHGLRHTFATLGLEKGVDPIYMKELLGHATTAMLSRYQHARPARLAGAVEQLTEGIGSDQHPERFKGKRRDTGNDRRRHGAG